MGSTDTGRNSGKENLLYVKTEKQGVLNKIQDKPSVSHPDLVKRRTTERRVAEPCSGLHWREESKTETEYIVIRGHQGERGYFPPWETAFGRGLCRR